MYVDRPRLGFLPGAAMAAGPIMQALPGIITAVGGIGRQTFTPLPPTQVQQSKTGWILPAVAITAIVGMVGLVIYLRRRR